MNNYIGNKGGQGIREFLVNFIPRSNRYFSLFYGAGGLENCKYLSDCFWICSEKNLANKRYETDRAVISYFDYKDLIAEINFTADDFIFSDPPYIFSSRRAKRKYYDHEFNIPDHIEFLDYMISIDGKILITHPKCNLYDSYLSSWNNVEFEYMTRGGMFKDSVYFNYEPGTIELVNYSCLGSNFIDRQRIKRKRENFVKKFKGLSFHEQRAILRNLENYL